MYYIYEFIALLIDVYSSKRFPSVVYLNSYKFQLLSFSDEYMNALMPIFFDGSKVRKVIKTSTNLKQVGRMLIATAMRAK